MSRHNRQRRRRTPAGKRGPAARRSGSLAIPILVGVVVIAMIVGAVISLESRRPVRAALPAGATAGPLPTLPIPNPGVPRISLQDLQVKLVQGEAVLVDVRGKAAYDEAHAQGAISFPEAELDARLGELPRDKDLVFYCT